MDFFGRSVGISGSYSVIGASGKDINGNIDGVSIFF
jgi:hypothetical protein